jgi:hypothetical protein
VIDRSDSSISERTLWTAITSRVAVVGGAASVVGAGVSDELTGANSVVVEGFNPLGADETSIFVEVSGSVVTSTCVFVVGDFDLLVDADTGSAVVDAGSVVALVTAVVGRVASLIVADVRCDVVNAGNAVVEASLVAVNDIDLLVG